MRQALVVEDLPDVREWLADVARSAFPELEVTTAARAEEGLAQAASRRFDIALVDLGLPDGNGIDIDLRRQILLVVRGGQVKYVLNTSTGGGYDYERKDGSTATARTPKGSFRVYHSVDGRDEGFLGEMWRPRYFKGGYAVHGSPSIPPYPASHGCARLSNAAMNLIWARDYMPMGSTVLVR